MKKKVGKDQRVMFVEVVKSDKLMMKITESMNLVNINIKIKKSITYRIE